MIDDRTRQRIKDYFPHPPDPELGFNDYYYRQSTMKGEQVIKVHVTSCFPGQGLHAPMEYEIYQYWGNRLRWVDVGWGDQFRGALMSQLYDNKEDCRDQTHLWAEDWEKYRRIQKEEGLL